MEGLNNVSEIVSMELNQIEIMNILDNVIKEIQDFKNIFIVILSFIIGYLILRDFLNNIFRW